MNRSDTVITGALATVGVLALLLGLGTIVYAHVVIKPHLEEISDQGLASIELADRGLKILIEHSDVAKPLNPPQSNTLATLQALPTALEQSANASEHAAETLTRSANTLREIEDDLGIILPGNALRQNAEAMSTFAQSLQGLSPVLYQMHEQVDTVAADLTRASEQADQLQKALQSQDVTLEQVHAQVTHAQNVLRSTNLPTEITRLIGMIGGFFIGLGILLLAMAGLWRRVALLDSISKPQARDAESS